jgi:hypothetical protein
MARQARDHLDDHWTLDKPMIIKPVPVPCNDTHGSPQLPGALSNDHPCISRYTPEGLG